MNIFKAILKILFWAVVGYLPFYWWRFERVYSATIGCPKSGDCYVPGSEHLITIDTGVVLSAVILLPLAFWKIFSIFWDFLKKIGAAPKKKPGGKESKHGGGYRSPEEFHADFRDRYGRPDRVPEDVG